MKTLTMVAVAAACLILAAAALAQQASKPGPDHKKLDVFAGNWMIDGEIKPGSMGPGGKITEYERCECRLQCGPDPKPFHAAARHRAE